MSKHDAIYKQIETLLETNPKMSLRTITSTIWLKQMADSNEKFDITVAEKKSAMDFFMMYDWGLVVNAESVARIMREVKRNRPDLNTDNKEEVQEQVQKVKGDIKRRANA